MAQGPLAGEEVRLTRLFLDMLVRWLRRALDAVTAPFRLAGLPPDPTAIYQTLPEWEQETVRFVQELTPSLKAGWEGAGVASGPFVSSDSFIQAQLALTQNLLAGIPYEVYNLIFAEVSDAVNAGEGVPETAARIDRALSATGSANWPHRAEVVAVTEVNRAGNSAALAAAYRAQELEGVRMLKQWLDSDDRRVRAQHREADGQSVPLEQPFTVGQSLLMYPGDPTGQPEDVINCRCSLLVVEASP